MLPVCDFMDCMPVFLVLFIFLNSSLLACLFSKERRTWIDGEVERVWKDMGERKL